MKAVKRAALLLTLLTFLTVTGCSGEKTEASNQKENPDATTEIVYTEPELEAVAEHKELCGASENCLIFKDDAGYGICLKSGVIISEDKYESYLINLQNNYFALTYKVNDIEYIDVYSDEGKLVWQTSEEYLGYELKGISGGYMTLYSKSLNAWCFLDVNDNFSQKVFVSGDDLLIDDVSLANAGVAAVVNADGLSYAYIDLNNGALMPGIYEETSYIETAGCPADDDAEFLSALYAKTTSGDYCFKSLGFFDTKNSKFSEVTELNKEGVTLSHIYNLNGSGINTYDCVDGLVLLNNGETSNLYDVNAKAYVTDFDPVNIYMSGDTVIAEIQNGDATSYSYLDENYQKVGDSFESAAFFVKGFGLAVKDGTVYAVDADYKTTKSYGKAKEVYRRFAGYAIFESENDTYILMSAK